MYLLAFVPTNLRCPQFSRYLRKATKRAELAVTQLVYTSATQAHLFTCSEQFKSIYYESYKNFLRYNELSERRINAD